MRPDTRILIISNQLNDPKELRSMFCSNGRGPDIVVARSHLGALEMVRQLHPQLCILRSDMAQVEGRSFADALKQACPETDVFIVENGDLAFAATADA
jgi:DNA-binding NarL/FixJ family response regulator